MASNLKKLFPRVRRNVAIAPLTSFGVGGRAAWYLKVYSPEELVATYLKAKSYNLKPTLISGGSNVIFPDKTFPGLLIHYLNPRGKIACQGESLTCDAGLPLVKLINFAIKNNLAGLEALSGIPGTVGGAVVGNAGAYGQAIADCLEKVEVFKPSPLGRGRVGWISKRACQFIYRDSIFKRKDWLVLKVVFKLKKADGKILAKKSREIIKVRNSKYLPELKSPGSFFKNVLMKDVSRAALKKIDQSKIVRDPSSSLGAGGKIPTGYLLEEVGAKGLREGEAVVANFHGNLIINEGHATYADVIKLVTKLKKLVKDRFGIELEEEVRYML